MSDTDARGTDRRPGFEAAGAQAATKMSVVAMELCHSLTAEQRRAACYPAPPDPASEAERVRWFYTPTDHGGLALREQSATQQGLTMRLLSTGLSPAGYATIATILGLENVLDHLEDWKVTWDRERGRDPLLYWIRFFGTPANLVWGWRFGGHHVSVNILVVAGRVVASTPSFIGADPATSPLLGGELRPLGGPEETARSIVRSLDVRRSNLALLHPRAISDIVSGNRVTISPGDEMMHMQDLWRKRFADQRLAAVVDDIDARAEAGSGYDAEDHRAMALTIPPAGINATLLNQEQRDDLRRLIAMFTGRAPGPLAEAHDRWYADDAVLDEITFGWAGSTERGAPHYFRVQGPRLLVEYDNTQRNANHAHSVWRDFANDFGLDDLARHRVRAHGG